MHMEDKKNFIINVLYYVIVFGLIYLSCNYLLGILAPFILGFIFAYFAVRIAKKIFKKESKLHRILALVLLYIVVVAIIILLVVLGINEISGFISNIPSLYKQYVDPVFHNIGTEVDNKSKLSLLFALDLKDIYSNLLDSIKTAVSTISTSIVSSGTSLISSTTETIVAALTMIITSFFVVSDYESIIWYFESLLSPNAKQLYEEIKDFMFNNVFSVIKCYVIIMFITFAELFIGLGILGVNNFALIAMIVSFLDILPVLGVGTVLIPWFIFELIVGKIGLGIGLLALYLIITVIRNIIEPKFVGSSLGLHPLATLFTMLIGLKILGILGMFGVPIVCSFFIKRKEQNS